MSGGQTQALEQVRAVEAAADGLFVIGTVTEPERPGRIACDPRDGRVRRVRAVPRADFPSNNRNH